jgi:hypothetical protein
MVKSSFRAKMTVFWDVAPCSLVEAYRRFREAYGLNIRENHRPDDGGSKNLHVYCDYSELRKIGK